MKKLFSMLLFIALVLVLIPRHTARAQGTPITTDGMINAYNNMRVARGLAPLIVDPILMQTAQETADLMALYHLMDHMGNARGRIIAAGYGAGDIAWATENWAMGAADLETLLSYWADDAHMIPAVNPYYKHVGAGIATYNGSTYYIMHAAYTSNGSYQTTPIAPDVTLDPNRLATAYVSQIIFPVHTSTPSAEGPWLHEVRSGQSLWSIAIAYDTHIIELQRVNGMALDDTTIYAGQKLWLPTPGIAPDILASTATAAVAASAPAALSPTPGAQNTGLQLEPTATLSPTPTIRAATPTPKAPTPTEVSVSTATPIPPVVADSAPPSRDFIGTILIIVAGIGLLLVLAGAFIKK